MIVTAFQPPVEAGFWVIRAVWHGTELFHPKVYWSASAAAEFAGKVRAAGRIDPSRWAADYPRSDFELIVA